jgi:hypothetical protein
MAKVTIIIEDQIDAEGNEGVRLEVDSDPDFPEATEKQTIAQSWAQGFVDMMLSASDDHRFETKDFPLPGGSNNQTH